MNEQKNGSTEYLNVELKHQPLLGKSYFEYDANFFSFYRLFFVKYKKNRFFLKEMKY